VADPTEGRWASAVVGTLMLATGVGLLIGGFHERHDARGLRARGVVADATVMNTAAEVRVQQVGGVFSAHRVQRVTFDFVDVHDVPRSSTMKFFATDYEVGESVRLVYDSGAPEHIDVFHSCDGWLSCDRVPVLSMAMGFLMCLLAAAPVIAEFPRRRAARRRRRVARSNESSSTPGLW
jgi:hypothetical protein